MYCYLHFTRQRQSQTSKFSCEHLDVKAGKMVGVLTCCLWCFMFSLCFCIWLIIEKKSRQNANREDSQKTSERGKGKGKKGKQIGVYHRLTQIKWSRIENARRRYSSGHEWSSQVSVASWSEFSMSVAESLLKFQRNHTGTLISGVTLEPHFLSLQLCRLLLPRRTVSEKQSVKDST